MSVEVVPFLWAIAHWAARQWSRFLAIVVSVRWITWLRRGNSMLAGPGVISTLGMLAIWRLLSYVVGSWLESRMLAAQRPPTLPKGTQVNFATMFGDIAMGMVGVLDHYIDLSVWIQALTFIVCFGIWRQIYADLYYRARGMSYHR